MKQRQILEAKIQDLETLIRTVKIWKFKGNKIVFTNGCFDIIHQGHIDYLAKAADLGTKLVVGVNTDASVKTLGKGDERPIQDEKSRALIISALHFVDAVCIFGEETPLNLIKSIEPDVLVKGSDYELNEIVGYKEVKAMGGETKRIDFLEGYSTSRIVKKIKNESDV